MVGITSLKPGLQGFVCPLGRGNVPFSFCEFDCPDPCHPLPLLASLLESREIIPGTYSVTELLKPYQLIYLARHNAFWVDPESQIYMVAGSAAHAIIEEGGKKLSQKDLHKTEVRGNVTIQTVAGSIVLRGTFDYDDVRRLTLWDFKNSKVYPVQKLKRLVATDAASWLDEDYFKQLNIYKTYFNPKATRLRLEILVQGWTIRDGQAGIKKIEQIEVPVASEGKVRDWIADRTINILAHESNPSLLPKCTKEETWGGKRCADYCVAKAFCPQFNKL